MPDVDPAELGAAYEALGDAYHQSSAFQRAAEAYADARRAFDGSPRDEARVMLERSKVESTVGSPTRALAWASRARTKLKGMEDLENRSPRVQIDSWYATVLQGAGRLPEAQRWCQVVMSEAEQADAPRALAQAYFVLGWSDFMAGRPAEENMARALGIYEELGELVGQANMALNLGVAKYYAGHWREARELWVRSGSVPRGRRCGDSVRR